MSRHSAYAGGTGRGGRHEGRLGDIYNAVATWEEILIPLKWKIDHYEGQITYWKRPNKDAIGHSALTNYGGMDKLFNFSSSVNLPIGKPLNKFYVYTMLYHNGDYPQSLNAIHNFLIMKGGYDE